MIPWQTLLIDVGDRLLGWTLRLPRDLALLILAVASVGILLSIRLIAGNRTALERLIADERRLKMLQRQARVDNDNAARQRNRRVRRLLAAHRLRLELLPALLGLLPACLVLMWGSQRLNYLPLMLHQPFDVTAAFPVSVVGEHAHVVPQTDLSVTPSWIQIIEPSSSSETRGTARWTLVANALGVDSLVLRHPSGSVRIPVEIGTRHYVRPEFDHGNDLTTRVTLSRFHPLGIVPAIPWLGWPPWLVGLLLMVVPGYLAGRRLLRVP